MHDDAPAAPEGRSTPYLPPLREDIQGLRFPADFAQPASGLLGGLYQLEASQWWTGEQLATLQIRRLEQLLLHAWQTCPGYQPRLKAAGYVPGRALDDALWQRIPVLERVQLQEAEASLTSKQLPPAHGKVKAMQSSGSTGRPVRTLSTQLTAFFWQLGTMRDHLWHRRDFSAPFVAIRPDRGTPQGSAQRIASWGPPVNLLFESGPAYLINSREDIGRQLDQLLAVQPGYLLSMPSNLRELAHAVRRRGVRFERLREIRSFSENLTDETRALLGQVFAVPVSDMYSATEVGYMALQCASGGQWHVQSETLRVEILDEHDRPCAVGEPGRVVVTPLYNFALPLIRYAVGDFAQWGEPCVCGRGLPVLSRVFGRTRGMARTPDGRRFWPSFPSEAWLAVADIRQIQLSQVALDRIEARYVAPLTLTDEQRQQLTKNLHASLGYPFLFDFLRVDGIPLQANGKYEDFISKLA